jgi:hypothetical protein
VNAVVNNDRTLRYSALLLFVIALALAIAAVYLFSTPFNRIGALCALLAAFFLWWARNCWVDAKEGRRNYF